MSIATRTYCPRAGSIPAQTIQYFQKNLSAKLTRAEATAKFGTSNIAKVLEPAIEAGFIASDSGYYTAGDDIDQAPDYGSVAQADATIKAAGSAPGAAHNPFAHAYKAAPSAVQSAAPSAAPAKRASPNKAPLPDPAAIALDDDVPLATAKRVLVDWAVLFNRMQPGQSCKLPKHAKAALAKATQEQHKSSTKRFAIKKISDTEIRIWRTA